MRDAVADPDPALTPAAAPAHPAPAPAPARPALLEAQSRLAGPHPHDHHLVPAHWSHTSSTSPFSTQLEYGLPTSGPRQQQAGVTTSTNRTGRLPLVPPTRAEYVDPSVPGRRYRWTARAHRKGVPPRLVREHDQREEGGFAALVRRHEKNWWRVVRNVRWWGWDLGDISWWVGFLFTLGSVWWCIQGIQVFCYPNNTSTVFTNTEAAMSFLGGTTFLVGGYLGYVESLNPAFADWDGAFGYELTQVKRELSGSGPRSSDEKSRAEVYPPTLGKRRRHFGSHAPPPAPFLSSGTGHLDSSKQSSTRENRSLSSTASARSPSSSSPSGLNEQHHHERRTSCPQWKWFGLPPAHKRLDLGFLANAIQLFGAVAFEISVISGLPGVLGASGNVGGPDQSGRVAREWIGAYWAMQIVGSPCFTVAGLIFSLETQTRWYKPNLVSIGWWIGAWNVIGGFGFWFCGIFGIWRQTDLSNPEHFQHYGTAFSTFWGSWAFLIGSYIQMLETLNKWT
ncbi:hypothetical protein JCM3774_000005 [Rhodotorula dairenensis]